ncbi:hypothetical protein MRX96_053133 [Rhipicephalus microplus]
MGPLNEKGDHILVCIDHATRYMDTVTVPSTSSTHYLEFMTNRWIPRFGVPSVIITDQAKGFVNKKTNQFNHRLGIAHQNSPPYWPQSKRTDRANGRNIETGATQNAKQQGQMAEGTTPSNASNQCHEASSQWPQPISTHARLRPKTARRRLNLASVEGDIDESHRVHDLARGRAETRERLLQSQRKITVRYDKKRRTPRFITGDLVLLELSARGTLDPRYEGPFEITALVGGNRAEIQRVPHTHRA